MIEHLAWYLNLCLLVQLISFIDPPYSTQEESGFITVSVGIRNPGFELDDDFVVNLETMDIPGTINAAQGNIAP